MGCGDACYEDWDLPAVRPIRDDIHHRVRHLLTEVTLRPDDCSVPVILIGADPLRAA